MRIAIAGGTGVVGRYLVGALREAGHEVLVLTRSTGFDLMEASGLSTTLTGVDAVVDASGPAGSSGTASVRFFTTVTSNLLRAEEEAGVQHHVALSIVGAAKINAGYYAGKKAQENLVSAADIPWTILRATQFHEFAAQLIPRGRVGPIQAVPAMRSQPIAAAEVAAVLAETATGDAQGLLPELAGPKEERMSELVRRYLRATGDDRPVLEVRVPGAWWRGLRDGSCLPGPGARLGKQTFSEWLVSAKGARR
ncbi:MAG TPA: NAD(P)H-binding protein [Galbitalea sp.]